MDPMGGCPGGLLREDVVGFGHLGEGAAQHLTPLPIGRSSVCDVDG